MLVDIRVQCILNSSHLMLSNQLEEVRLLDLKLVIVKSGLVCDLV